MRWTVVMFCLGLSLQVQAACSSLATTPASFGTVTSTALRQGGQQTSTLQAGLICSKVVVALFGTGDHIYLNVSPGSNGLVSAAGDVVTYQLYADATTATALTRGTAFDYATSSSINLLGLFGNSNPGAPLYMRMTVGNDVPAGIYRETLTLNWNWNYCSTVAVGGACIPARDIGSAVSTLVVNLTVTNDCVITTTSINFSSAPVVTAFSSVNASVFLACTKQTAYTIGLNDGNNPLGGRRRMVSGTNFLAYDLYKGSGITRWGSVGAERRSSSTADVNPGPGLGNVNQRFDLTARIYSDQLTPPAATYLDSVLLDVQF